MEVKQLLKQLTSYPSIRKELHAEYFKDDLLLTKDGRYCKTFVVETAFENSGLTQYELDRISEAIQSVLSTVDYGLKVDVTAVKDRKINAEIEKYRKLTENRPERFKKLSDGIVRTLEDGIRGIPYKGIYPRRLRYFITVSSTSEKSSIPSAVRELLPFYSEGNAEEIVRSNAEKIASQLKTFGIEARPATREEIVDLFYFVLNPRKSYLVSPPSLERIPDTVCQSYVEVINDTVNQISYLVVDQTSAFPVRLNSLTPYTAGQMGRFLIDYWEGDCVINFSVYLSRNVLGKTFELLTKRMIRNAYSNNPTDVEIEDKFLELQEFERRKHRGDREVFFDVNAVFYGERYGEKSQDVKKILSFLKKIGRVKVKEGDREVNLFPEGTVEIDRYTPVHTLLQTLPGNLNVEEYRFRTMLSNACDYTPMVGAVRFPGSEKKPASLFLTREGDVVRFSLFDAMLNAWLAVITGDTGSGKSYTANYFISDLIAQGVKLWILDKQDSYVKLCKYAGGNYYRVTLESPVSFNIFDGTDIEPKTEEERDYKAEKLKVLLNFLRTVLGRDQKLTAVEEGILTEAVSRYLKEGGSDVPILGEFRKFLKDFGTTETQRRTAEKFHSILATYTEEEGLGKFFNRKTSFNEDAQVSVLEVGQIQDNPALIETLLMVFLSYINYYSYRNRKEHKAFIGDEIWSFLTTPSIANFFVTIFRTYRKLGTGAILISQYLKDFTGETGGVDLSAILKSTFIFITMNQPHGDIRELQEKGLIPFREEDVRLFDTTNPEYEGVAIRPKREFHLALKNYGGKKNKSAVLLPIITPFHDWLFTTDSDKVAYFMEELTVKMMEGMNESEAVAVVADSLARRFPFGRGFDSGRSG